MATESLQARLTDFERQARGVCIGVNHLALDSERARQAELLQKIMQLEKDIQQSGAQKSHLPEAAAEIRDDVKNNTAALRYLETISQLENSFTVLTENVTETSVQLSSPKELKDEVHVKKELSNNVKSCWSYVSQLARLSQVHIRNAAEYHQFHHAISEVEASLKARVRMTDVRNQRHVPATLKNCTILANEFREHLNHMIHLWGRSGNLLEESRRIVPIHLRLGGIIDGVSTNTETPSPVMARMLTSLTGPNYELKEGEEVRLISNRDDQHFWTVQTNNGIVKIPSVCLWISDPDLEAVKRAVILREKCIESWDLLVERSRERLRSYYSCLLNQMAENGDIYYNNKTAMDNFLDDLRSHLLLPNDNNRTSELGQAIYAFTDRLKMADINRQRGGTVLREQDIVCMHSPLLRLRDHERQMEHLRAQSELLGTHMTNYLREIDADQKRVDNELSLIDQLQHESQSQLDQLISRVKRWSSRFEHEPNIDSSITNSRLSSSIKSSTISDNYPQAVGPTRSIVRDQSRFSGSSLRSDSIPRAVVDAITQIGVTTRTQGTQSSEYLGDIELRPMKGQYYSTTSPTATLPPPERKLMRNAITQIGIARADTGVQGDDYLPLPTSIHTKKRSVKEVLCQIGQITANASCQTLEMQKPQLETPLPLPVVQPPPKKCTLDAVVQSGVITKNNSAQCDYIQEKTIMKTEQPQQKPPKKLNILDAICQIGQVTQSIGIQSQLEKVEKPSKHFGVQVEPTIDPIHKKPTTEAICQIGKITMNASTETSPNLFIQPNLVKKASTSDITCQIGKIERTASTQTTATMADVIEEKAILHDVTYQHNIPRSNFCHQADLISRPKSVSKTINDVVCQVGQVRNDVSTQSMIEQQQLAPIVVTAAPSKPACRDTGVNPVQPLTKQITANNDVVTQTGIVFSTKIIQAEVREETQPVYVKTIETKDAPITSYKENMNACQQADLIQHILRRPTSDVVCQVGSVTETTGSQMEDTQRRRISQAATQSIPHAIDIKEVQTDVKQKLLPRPMNDVVCQVGQVRNDVSTQSVEYAIVKPPCRDTGVDPVHAVRDKVSNDVVTQTGIVHASKVTQAELREEQPVYVKTIETKDAPITSYKENMNACQQADLIQHILRRPTSDVVCQVGSVTETTGSQMEDTQRRRISQAATQSIPHAIDIKEVQTDVKQKLLPRPMNDVVCQVGQVRNDVSTQSVEYAIVKPPCRDTGVDPVHAVRDKVSNDVVTQTGIVHASKVTQAELREEQPVYVKTIETKDAPITSYKENMNACQQADLIQHILRRPTSDVVCQVGSVTETTGSQMEDTQRRRISQAATQSIPHAIDTSAVQVDMTPKLSPKAMHDVVCQVGHLKNETSTQSVEYAIIKPTCRETGVNPVQLWDKKVSNDVVTQTGLVHTSKVTETDLIKQEKPTVFMKMTETQPLPHPRETKESGQQVTFTKMAPIPRSLSDVICQVGSISQDFGVQVGDHKKESFPMATQSTTGHFDRSRSSFSAQTDMLIKFPERRSVSCYDLITQCGVVNDSKACQTIEPELHVKTQILEKTQKHIIKPQLDVVVQTGVVMRTEQTMTATTDTSPMISVGVDPRPTIPVREVSSYQAPPMIEKQNRHVQVYMKPMATNKDIQTESIMTKDATITSDLLRTPPPPIIPYEVVTQTGVLKQNIDTQTTFVEWRPVIQSTDKYVQSETVQTIPEIQTVAKRDIKYDVQTQSGIMRQSQAFQTPTIPKPTVNLRSTGIQNVMDMPQKVMKHATVETVAKQFDVKVQTESITQPRIMPMAQTTHRPTQTFDAPTQTERIAVRDQQVFTSFKTQVYDAQTQSGSTVKTQAVQTPIEQRPVIEMKELSTQHEKRPEPTVHKKLQAIVQSLTANIETQTMDYRPPPAFDVQTQSGVVRVDSESQTPIERRPVVEVKDASVYHTLESIPTVHKKLQAAVIPRLDNISTQTDPMPQPVIMPTVQTTHRPPQLLDTQTQTEGTRVRDQQSFTSFESKIFDVQTQFGSILKSQAVQTPIEQRPVIEMKELSTQHEKRPEPTVHKKLQAVVQSLTANIETQTMDYRPPPAFDVQTQSGVVRVDSESQTPIERRPVVEVKDASVYHTLESIPTVHKKLQAAVIPRLDNISTQTDPMPQPVIMPTVQTTHRPPQLLDTQTQTEGTRVRDQQSFTSFESKIFDVQTQFGSILKSQAVQTPIEQRPVIEMKELSTQHEKRPEPTVHKKLQAVVQSLTANIETQTMDYRPPPAFDVQTQSGVVRVDSESQTPIERRPVVEVKDASVYHTLESIPTVHKKLQAAVIPRLDNISTQTDPMPQPVIMPTVQTTHRPPQLLDTQTQTEGTRVRDQQSFTSFESKIFDVQTQFGSILKSQAVQTPIEQRPVIEMKELSTQHEKRPEPTVHKKLQAVVQSLTANIETQTMDYRPPPAFDVQTQSGVVRVDSESQTPIERRPVVEVKDASVYHTLESIPTVHKKLQAAVIPRLDNISTQTDPMPQPVIMPTVQTTHRPPQLLDTQTQTEGTRVRDQQSFTSFESKIFDVQTQFGSILKSQAVQTPIEQRPVIEMKELSTQHEKRPEPTVHKKLQAVVQSLTANIETQTMDYRPPPAFDVQTQSGVVRVDSESQTPIERRPVVEVKDASVYHTLESIPTVHKKLQAAVIPRLDNISTQTDPMPQPVVIPTIQTTHLPPVISDVQTQSGIIHKTQASQTVTQPKTVVDAKESCTQYEPIKTVTFSKDIQVDISRPTSHRNVQTDMTDIHIFDVQTQSGVIRKPSEAQTAPAMLDASVTHEDQRQSVNKKLQAIVQMPLKDTFVQAEMIEKRTPAMIRRETFDVQTQSGSVRCSSATQTPPVPVAEKKDLSVLHAPQATPSTNKKLQAMVTCPSDEKCLQTEDYTLPAIKPYQQSVSHAPQVVHQHVQTEFKRTTTNTFDVVTQSGTIYVAQAVQTLPEVRPVIDTSDVSVIHHRERTPSTNRKLQAAIRQSVSSTSTQTEPMKAEPMMLTKNTFDVVTQSGTIYVAQAVQTLPEVRPVVDTSDVSVIHHRERTPSTNRKLQAAIRQSVSSTSTQTEPMKAEPMMLTKNTFDVVTQSGTIYVAQAVQTLPEVRPVVDTSDVSVIHHRERTPSTNRKLQAAIRQSVSSTSTQTEPMKAEPMMSTKNTFDVVTQSGTIYVAQAVQTLPEVRPVVDTSDVSVIHHRERTPSTNRKLQAAIRQSVSSTSTQTEPMKAEPVMLTKNTFDVVTQSGTLFKSEVVQVDLVGVLATTKDLSVHHERKLADVTHRDIQVSLKIPYKHVSVQSEVADLPLGKSFNVETQCGVMRREAEAQTSTPRQVEVKDSCVQHRAELTKTVNKKLQALVTPSLNTIGSQTPELQPVTKVPVIQASRRPIETDETMTQTDALMFPEIQPVKSKKSDVQAQSGIIHKTQASQTVTQPKTVVDAKESCTQYEPIKTVTFSKDIQVDISRPTSHRNVQTDMTDIHIFDVQTQSGVIRKPSEAQTAPAMLDASVTHEDQRQSVNKKLQAIVQMPLKDTFVQAEMIEKRTPAMIRRETFDVQTQSGSVRCSSATQTPPVPVAEKKDLSVLHAPQATPSTNKKLQAMTSSEYRVPSDTRDINIAYRKPASPTPELAPYTVNAEVQCQPSTCSSWIQTMRELESRPELKDASVAHKAEDLESPLIVERPRETAPSRRYTSTSGIQTDESLLTLHRSHVYDVQTESGKVVRVAGVQTDIPIHKQDVTSSTFDIQTQSGILSRDSNVQTVLPAYIHTPSYDVQLQSGIMTDYTGVQTLRYNPLVYVTQDSYYVTDERQIEETRDKSIAHIPEKPTLKGKKLQVSKNLVDSGFQVDVPQVITQPIIKSTMHTVPFQTQSTQTIQSLQTDGWCQAILTRPAYDVQTQFGVLHAVDGTQTVAMTPVAETKETTVVHEKEPIQLKGKKLQVRSSLTDSQVQTEEMTPAVLPTIASTIHAVPVSIQSVQTVEKKVAEMSCQVAVPSSAYDVQTQFGVLHAVDGTQTVAMTPVAETKETTVVHEKEPIQLKGKKLQVRSSLTDSQVQTEEMTPAVLPTIASTIHAVPVSIQSVQTVEKKVAEMSCQVAVPSSAYDVQTQFGVLHAVDGTQTVAMTPVAETKETTVVHEKEPIQLKGKKLQVRSSLTDSHCQTEQTSQYTEVKSIQTTPIQQKDSSCQYVIETIKPTSITSHTVSSQSISVQTTTDLPSLFHAQRTDQRNKKFQVNLISIPSPRTPTAISTHVTSSSTQTPSYEYKDISLEQHTEEKKAKPPTVMIHSSVSNINVTPTTTQQLQQHIIPKIKIDQECQVKISPQQYDKKLQYGQSFSSLKDVSLQYTDSFDRDQSSKVQFKNKKLQVIPSKLGSEGGEVLTHDKDVQCSPTLDEKSVKPTKQATATSTIRSQYFTRILQMDTLPEIEKNSKQTTTDDYLLERLPLFKHRSDDRDSDHDDKIKMSTSVVQLEKPTAEQCCQIDFRRNELIAAAASYHQSDIHIRDSDIVFQKRLQEPRRTPIIDSTGYYSHEYHSVGINTRFSPSTSPRTATSRTRTTPSPPSSTRSKTRSPKSPDVVSWGVQSAPVMLTGVTQTTETLKHKISLDLSISTGVQTDLPLSDAGEDDYYIKRVVTTIARKGLSSYCRRGPVTRKIIDHSDLLTSSLPSNLNVGQHEGDDEAEDQLDEEMIAVGDQLPKTSKKITTIHKHGDRRYVREELFTEDYKDRGSSLDSRLAYGAGPSGGARSLREVHLQDIDLHDMHEHDDIYTDAEICFQNLLTLWGQQYLLSRVRMIGRSTTTPELSVTLDRARSESGKSRLIEAKTQFTSTGNLVTSLKNISSVATQTTSDIPFVTRPPHKNKRIQRGHSFIAKASGSGVHQPTRTGSAVSPLSPTTEELTTIGHHRQQQQQGIAGTTTTTTTTYTETTHEQQSMLSLEQTYVCPACGNQATIPIPLHTTSIQPQVLPITQLKDAQAQTRFHEHQSQALTTDKQCTYIPVYLTDEDVIRINPSQRIEEEKEYSMVTWHPATTTETDRRRDDSRNDDRGGQDEVWIDSPGKLFELKLKEVIIPGTNKYISAGEAFYRGLLRVVYWDYEKLGGRQSSLTDSSAASIPLTDAVISKAVRLAHEKSVHPHQQAPSSLDAKIVWRTPEIQRHRYIVHSIRPPPVYPGQSRHTPITLDITSAIRTGLIDKDTGCMLFTTSVVKKGDSSGSSSEQTERLSVREAMVRGYLVAEFIQPEASRMMKTITQSSSVAYVLPSTSYTSHSPTDVDI
uniref:Desmoplakin SH3 domain-containing protein n=1 Tax=Trichobilharzia regenti TaxID=157069 RepID=A0AA85JL11_TRIRE|nr:unnamed protein product [Trichobilharzia regenti]